MKVNPCGRAFFVFVAPLLLLTGCKDEEQTKKIKELEEQAAERDSDVEKARNDLNQAQQDRDKARNELDQAKRDLQASKSLAENLQRQLDSVRKAEQRQREIANQEASRNPEDEARASIQQKFAAIWQITGDQKSIHGIVAEADGKTWFYFPANSLGADGKLAIKDSAGNTVTKLGEFQVAADVNLARLEIKQDVAVKIPLHPDAALGENAALLAVVPGDDGKLQLLDCAQGAVSPTEIELSLSAPTAAGGYPVFSAENGSLICITAPTAQAANGPWPQTAAADGGLLRVPRLNRPIDWKPATINSMLGERRKIDELNRFTRLVSAAASLSISPKGFNLDAAVSGGSQTAKQVFDDQKGAPGVQDLIKLNENLATQKLRISENDLVKQVSGIFGQIGSASQRCLTEAKAIKASPPNRRDLENALKWNEEALKKLNEKLSDLTRR